MDVKYLKKVALYLVSVILALALIFYILYHLFNGFTTDITTMTAEISLQKSTIEADGYIFRDEKCLYSKYSGAVNYFADDGEKVSINQTVAEAYSDTSSYNLRSQVLTLDERISLLEGSLINGNLAFSDTSLIDTKISSYYHIILSRLSENKYNYVLRSTDDLLTQLNKRQIITGELKATDIKSLIADLETEKSELTSRLGGLADSITTDESGYFFTAVDGYENIFGISVLNTLTVDSFYDLIAKQPENLSSGSAYPVGKLVRSFRWYIALPVVKSDTYKLETGNKYTAVFPYNYDEELSVTLEQIISGSSDERAVLVFSTGDMPSGFNYQRTQTVSIITGEYSGYRVPVSAVRLVNGFKGVYTLYGSTVIFKRINPLTEDDGYYIVSPDDDMVVEKTTSVDTSVNETSKIDTAASTESPPEKTSADTANSGETETTDTPSYSYIKLYDQIIISGKDLENGMVFY